LADASDVQPSADVWYELSPSDRFRNRKKHRPVSNIVLIMHPGALRSAVKSDHSLETHSTTPGLARKRE